MQLTSYLPEHDEQIFAYMITKEWIQVYMDDMFIHSENEKLDHLCTK
jgi:hypothetical protein